MNDRIREAIDLPACPRCGAAAGDPCRMPSWRTTAPHEIRLQVQRIAKKLAEKIRRKR